MKTVQIDPLTDRRGVRLTVRIGSRPATVGEVVAGWGTDPAFRSEFNTALASSPDRAFRWEMPGVTAATLAQPFESVLLASPELDRRPDPSAFAEHFAADAAAVAFPNLGKNAVMVVPCPIGSVEHYAHLAAFVRGASDPQLDAFWELVGTAMTERISTRPVWLNTAGAGVAWLHVRLDDRPKYYHFEPYRRNPE